MSKGGPVENEKPQTPQESAVAVFGPCFAVLAVVLGVAYMATRAPVAPKVDEPTDPHFEIDSAEVDDCRAACAAQDGLASVLYGDPASYSGESIRFAWRGPEIGDFRKFTPTQCVCTNGTLVPYGAAVRVAEEARFVESCIARGLPEDECRNRCAKEPVVRHGVVWDRVRPERCLETSEERAKSLSGNAPDDCAAGDALVYSAWLGDFVCQTHFPTTSGYWTAERGDGR